MVGNARNSQSWLLLKLQSCTKTASCRLSEEVNGFVTTHVPQHDFEYKKIHQIDSPSIPKCTLIPKIRTANRNIFF